MSINQGCILNDKTGPIYIGKNAEIQEGSMIRGPFVLCEDSIVKMGTKIYGGTTIGPNCRVGGEVNNVVFIGNSNKSHDGFMGNSVIGEWCNIGAGTNTSNLKNNYGNITVYDGTNYTLTDLMFCGLMMGDHSKCGINTMFNSGTVVGVSCNIFGGGYQNKFIKSFSWGDKIYDFDKSIEDIQKMMERRNRKISTEEIEILKTIYKNS